MPRSPSMPNMAELHFSIKCYIKFLFDHVFELGFFQIAVWDRRRGGSDFFKCQSLALSERTICWKCLRHGLIGADWWNLAQIDCQTTDECQPHFLMPEFCGSKKYTFQRAKSQSSREESVHSIRDRIKNGARLFHHRSTKPFHEKHRTKMANSDENYYAVLKGRVFEMCWIHRARCGLRAPGG